MRVRVLGALLVVLTCAPARTGRAAEPLSTQLWVFNHLGETGVLSVDGHRIASLGPGDSLRVPVMVGERVLHLHIPVTQHTEKLRVTAREGYRTEVALGPLAGRLTIRNDTTHIMLAYRNGRALGALPPGSEVEYAGQPLGLNLIEVVGPTNAVQRFHLVLDEQSSRNPPRVVVLASGPQVRVKNETGEPVKVGPDVAEYPTTLDPGQERDLTLLEGVEILRFSGAQSKARLDQRRPVSPDRPLVLRSTEGLSADSDLVSAAAPAGNRAVVICRNQTQSFVDVYQQGNRIAQVAPGDSFEIFAKRGEPLSVSARKSDGSRQWRLVDLLLLPGRRLGWTLTE